MASSDQFYYQFYYQLEFCYLRIQLNQMNQWEILCAMSRASSEEAAARQRQNQPARENVSRKRKVANGRGPGENGPAPLRTLKQYMIEEKLDIISYAKQAGNRAAGREYNVAESSIREWRKNEERLRYRRQEEILRATLALEPTRSRMPGAGRKPVEKKREECEEEEMIRQVPLSLRLMNEENIDLMHPSPSEVSPSVSGSSCPSTNSSPLTVVPESVSTTVSTGRLLQDSHGVCVPLPPSMRIPVPPCLDHFRGPASTFGMGRTDFTALPSGANLSQMISMAQYSSLQPYQSPPPLLSPPPIDDSLTLSTPGSGSSKRKAKNPRKIVLEDDVIPEAPVSVSVA